MDEPETPTVDVTDPIADIDDVISTMSASDPALPAAIALKRLLERIAEPHP